MSAPMKKSVDLRRRVAGLIKALEEVPEKHRTPAMSRLLTDLQRAADEYDGKAVQS